MHTLPASAGPVSSMEMICLITHLSESPPPPSSSLQMETEMDVGQSMQILPTVLFFFFLKAALKSLSRGLPWWLSGKDISLPMQETRVQSPDWDDPTCHRATKPVCHSYWACALEPESPGSPGQLWSPRATALKLERPRVCSLQQETHCTATREWPLLSATAEKARAEAKTQQGQ